MTKEEGPAARARGSGIDLDSYTRGDWMGSDLTQAEIDWLYRSQRIPEGVFCRIPGNEREPVPRPGEYVVFAAHFEHDLGLPASDFFRRFLDFYELQPHHLPGNFIFYLSSFTAFMEGYTRITPSVDNFSFFYYLRKNSIQDRKLPYPKPFVRCGGYILAPRQGSNFYKLSGLESVRPANLFYVRNGGPKDFINLPEYVPGPPSMKNWLQNPKDDKESQQVALFVDTNKKETNLCTEDLVRVFLSRRVLHLQRRAHKISQMSGPKDPTRITTHTLSATDLVLKAKQICQNPLSASGKYGLIPYSRSNPPPPRNFRRISGEEPPSYAPNRRFHDDCDADPYVKKKPKMVPPMSGAPGASDPHQECARHAAGLCRRCQDLPSSSSKSGTFGCGKSPPPSGDIEDTGASNMGAGNKRAAEPPVPPTPKKKKKKAAASPSKAAPVPSVPATSSPTKDAPSPDPAPPASKATGAPEPARPEGATFTAQQLAAAVTAATAPPSGSQSLVLHAGRAAVVAVKKASSQLGRIVELSRDEADLGPLRDYVEKWNQADLSAATRGLDKDKLPLVDNSGPRSTAQHLSRLKRAVKEFDTAWHDASANVVNSDLASTRKDPTVSKFRSREFSAVDSNFSSSDEEFSSTYFVDNKASGKLAKIFSNTSFESSADSFISSDSDSVDSFNFIDKSAAIGKIIRSKFLDQGNRHSSYPQ
ncbi:hypothetical protein QYE76_051895 [Lolium multiflorum]|uniref:Transposase (putative) gypsy type domain-containing protein n=1 Tax=Lolium multiflorum TaxID=4521 RepID=A0AAD8SSY1_LOLMU|nr:hypothetical protein QYE76_051895 [Lolium multiflorum]